MPDFYSRRDMSTVTSFADPNAQFAFPFLAEEQLIFNDSSDTIFEVSFDGQAVHGRVDFQGLSKAINWTNHCRNIMWIRRLASSGGIGEKIIQVLATTR